jgi:cation diffusion facilitator CzcD-associated flavoprotein CzcO
VVGSGKSAFDILGQARKYGADVSVVMRKTHWLVPVDLKVFGLPLGHFNSSRLGGLFLDPYYSERSWVDKITGFFAPVYWYMIMWFIKKGVPNELMSEESYMKEKHFRGGARDKTIFEDIGKGKIPLYRGSIEEVNSVGARINGKDIPADLIVFATGFEREFFGLPAEDDGLWLYRNILVPEKKNLAVIGIVNTYCNPLYTNMQALWLAEVLRGRVCLPSEIKMLEDVNERKAYTRTILSGENTISFSWFPYPTIDQLLIDMGLSIVRKPNRFKYWFEPIKPEDYKEVVTHRE